MRTPPSLPTLTIFASGCAAVMERSGLTFTPGPEPATPPVEYQQPPNASHVCHWPVATSACGLDGQSLEF